MSKRQSEREGHREHDMAGLYLLEMAVDCGLRGGGIQYMPDSWLPMGRLLFDVRCCDSTGSWQTNDGCYNSTSHWIYFDCSLRSHQIKGELLNLFPVDGECTQEIKKMKQEFWKLILSVFKRKVSFAYN